MNGNFSGLESRPEFSYDAFFGCIFTVADFDKAGLARHILVGKIRLWRQIVNSAAEINLLIVALLNHIFFGLLERVTPGRQ